LQQILFYRELGVGLDEIKEILSSPDFNETNALKDHYEKLLERRQQLDILISNVQKTILTKEGKIEVPSTSELSDKVSKDLKNIGFKFLGSTIVYAHLQAGLINDLLVGCDQYFDLYVVLSSPTVKTLD